MDKQLDFYQVDANYLAYLTNHDSRVPKIDLHSGPAANARRLVLFQCICLSLMVPFVKNITPVQVYTVLFVVTVLFAAICFRVVLIDNAAFTDLVVAFCVYIDIVITCVVCACRIVVDFDSCCNGIGSAIGIMLCYGDGQIVLVAV